MRASVSSACVVVGNMDIFGDDGMVRAHPITPAEVVAVGETSTTVMDRLRATTEYTTTDGIASFSASNDALLVMTARGGARLILVSEPGLTEPYD